MGAVPDKKMTVEEFLDWSERQNEGRYELVDGNVILMAPERILHAQVKLQVALALRGAVEQDAPDCQAIVDGPGIQISAEQVRIPDASIQCGPIDDAAQLLTNPVVVVEVISPSSARNDAIAKVNDYFSVTAIRHYLIVDPVDRMIIRHSRMDASADIHTQIHRSGAIKLEPPGISVMVENMLGPDTRNSTNEEGA